MRRVLLAALMCALPVSGFAKMYEEPRSFQLPAADKALDRVQRKDLPAVDVQKLLAEDRARGKNQRRPGPHRFAVAQDVSWDLSNSGTWQDLPDGRLWRLRIHSPNAVSHNLGITRYEMPQGAKLWVYDAAGKSVNGPYTSRNRSHRGSLWTPVITGEEMVVEVFVPTGVAQPSIVITKANQGYTGLKDNLPGSSPPGDCEIDVVCPEGNPWPNEIRAVGVYTLNGVADCTGTMVNNTAIDFTPYFLSANHCGVTAGNDDTVVVFWNFQSPICADHGPGSLADNQSGSTFRASSAPSDFLLIELDDKPSDLGFNVFYAGWDRSGVAPAATTTIHHPGGDVKSISFSNTPPLSAAYLSNVADPAGNHWRPVWDVLGPNPPNQIAVTEPGSSGSCLFDTNTHRCIGQLHGGPSFCGAGPASLNDFYGKLSVSWTGGGTNATRLSNWLDPGNTGVLGLDGDPHITTLDGTHYDFQGAGEYVALKAGTGAEVQVRQAPVATDFNPGANAHTGLATCVSLNTAVAARVGSHRVSYQPNLSGVPDPSGLQLRVDGNLVTLPAGGIDLSGGGRIGRTSAAGGIEIAFPDAYTLTVTPGWWTSQSKWYLNVGVARTGSSTAVSGSSPGAATGGLAGAIPSGSWLPTLPDGSSMGPRPAALHDRYVDLYQKFGEAWRVSGGSSLFDYAPGTSTDTFTNKAWPLENPPCVLPQTTPVKPVSLAVAQQACAGVIDRITRANCVFDVQVTGERGFAKTYLASQRVRAGATRVDLRDDRDPSKPGQPVTFTATVAVRGARGRVPTGTVQFVVDGERAGDKVRLDARGRAVWKAAQLAPGTHKVLATYVPAAGSGFTSANSEQELHVVSGKD